MADIYRSDIVRVDLDNALLRKHVGSILVTGDKLGNRFGAEVYRDGKPVDISDCGVVGYFMRPGEDTIILPGATSGSVAYVDLEQACYTKASSFTLTIKISNGGSATALRVIDGYILLTQTDELVDPGEAVPTLDDLLAQIEAMEQGTAAARNVVAEYEGKVAEQDASIAALSQEMNGFNVLPNLPLTWYRKLDTRPVDNSLYEVTSGTRYDENGNLIPYVNGQFSTVLIPVQVGDVYYQTNSSTSFFRLDKDKKVVESSAGVTYAVTDDRVKYIAVSAYKETAIGYSWLSNIADFNYSAHTSDAYEAWFVALDESVTLTNVDVPMASASTPGVVKVGNNLSMDNGVLSSYDGTKLGLFDSLEDGGDLNDVQTLSIYFLTSDRTYVNRPDGVTLGWVITLPAGVNSPNNIVQFCINWHDGKVYRRLRQIGTWYGWKEATGGIAEIPVASASVLGGVKIGKNLSIDGNGVLSATAEQVTYNVTARPSITTDTNNFLASTGDSTDVTASVAALLAETGVCQLGPGVFYIKDLQMPDGTVLTGCGSATKIKLPAGDGCCIKLGRFNTVSNLYFDGEGTVSVASESIGNRNAIAFVGSGTPDAGTATQQHCILSNLYITGFRGSGIKLSGTGYAAGNSVSMANCDIWNCDCGINIAYFSEYHNFSNVKVTSCYYGCINNGGNNMFSNCTFTQCGLGVLMDNSEGQSPNNTHGSMVGCIINHNGVFTEGGINTGIGIKVVGCANGYIFDGCQLFFSKIILDDCEGIVVSNTNFGYSNCDIEVSGGGAILFSGNMHQGQPTITVTDNDNVHFANCYVRSSGAVVTK